MANTETKVNELVINTMSEAKYASLKAAGSLNANELYFIKDDTEGVKSLGSATGDITLGSNLNIENNVLSATNTITSIDGKAGNILLGDGLVMDGYTLKATATGGGGNASIDDTQLSDTTTYSSNKINNTYLPLSGGSLTGPLITSDYFMVGPQDSFHLGFTRISSLYGTLLWQNGSTTLSALCIKPDGLYEQDSDGNLNKLATTEYVDSRITSGGGTGAEYEMSILADYKDSGDNKASYDFSSSNVLYWVVGVGINSNNLQQAFPGCILIPGLTSQYIGDSTSSERNKIDICTSSQLKFTRTKGVIYYVAAFRKK